MVYLGKRLVQEKKYKVLEEYINEVKKEKSMDQKKYRVKRYFYGIVDGKKYLVNSIIIDTNIADNDKQFDVNFLLKSGHIEEVKEDTLESIIDNNFIGDEIKKNLKQCIVNQKIELLKFIHLSYSEYIYNKISELQKEINENN